MIAQRMSKLDASGIRKVFDLAASMKNPINLSIGQPDFDVPDPVKDEAIRAIREGKNRYTVTQGIPELHERLRALVNEKKGYDPDALLVTSGVSGALLLAFMALVDEGDEALIPDPYFVMYKHLVGLCGGTPVFVNTYPDFKVTADRLREKITSRTKLLLLNSPANPTGSTVDAAELPAIAELAAEHNLLVLSDEIYDCFSYDMPPSSIGAACPNTLLMGGFSKSHGMTGWRLGYCAGPREVIAAMTMLQQYSFVCAPSFAQVAGLTALETDTSAYTEAYRRKRDLICDGLTDAGYEIRKPGGAFYVFPKAPWGTDMEFVAEAIRNNLLVIPGSVFSEKNTHFRISYAATEETIEAGLDALRKLIRQGPPEG